MTSSEVSAKYLQEKEQEEQKGRKKGKEEILDFSEARIADNVIWRIVHHSQWSDEEKAQKIAEVLTVKQEETAEETRRKAQERQEVMREINNFLQDQRTEFGMQVIRLNKSDVYPQLKITMQELLDQFNAFMGEFEDLTGPIEFIEELRARGDVLERLQKAGEDRALNAELTERIEEYTRSVSELTAEMEALTSKQERAKSQKIANFIASVFNTERKAELDQIDTDVAETRQKLQDFEAKLSDFRDKHAALMQALEDDPDRKKVMDMIDIGSEEYIKRLDILASSAENYINLSIERLQSARERFIESKKQIDELDKRNRGYTRIYALLAEGNQIAADQNQQELGGVHDKLGIDETGEEGEAKVSDMEALELKEFKDTLEKFLTAQKDYGAEYADVENELAKQSLFVEKMSRSNTTAMNNAERALSIGVSTASTRLGVVVLTINEAATRESTQQVTDTFERVSEKTNKLLQEGLREMVTDIEKRNREIAVAIQSSNDLKETMAVINQDMIGKMRDTFELINEAQVSAEELSKTVEETRGIEAEVHRRHSEGDDGGDAPEAADDGDAKDKKKGDDFGVFDE